MRTLVISDLHLGNRAGHDVLARPAVHERLLTALDGIDRLVLLGDTMELMTRRAARSMRVAEPVLRALGRRLGAEAEVILVPGNHDAPLVRRWARAQGGALTPSAEVPPHASQALAEVLAWLAPARARVSYPGVWLSDGVWAHHGHYLDHHLLPESAFGVRRPALRRGRGRAVGPVDYERARRRRGRGGHRARQTLPERLAERPVAATLEAGAELLRAATLPHLPQLLRRQGLAPVTARLIDVQMRYAAIPAMAEVVRRLGIDAEWVLFGHVHRRGPIADEHWPSGGSTRFVNTGCWLYEPLLLDRATPPHGYWPGGAVLLQDGAPPRSLGLLDDLTGAQLRPAPISSGAGSAARVS